MRNPHNDPLEVDHLDGAPQKNASPERRCILSGVHGPRDGLIRLALSPTGVLAPDVLARAPGRGAWIAINRADLEKTIANNKIKGALARAFKGSLVTVPLDLPERIEAALLRALTERLGLALRAGQLLMGTDRIADAARAGTVRWLGHAADAGADGVSKLAQAWRVGEDREGSGMTGQILPLDRAALSVALGRDNVVHLALIDAGAATRVATLLGRLLHFTGHAALAHSNDRDAGATMVDDDQVAGVEVQTIDDRSASMAVVNDDFDMKDAEFR